MIEVTKMWLMCSIFKLNEGSWDKDDAIRNLHLPGLRISLGSGQYRELTYEEKGSMILGAISQAKNYGVRKNGLIGAYLYRYRPWRRYKRHKIFWKHMEGYLLNYDGNNPKHQQIFSNAHSTLNNCIDDELIKPDEKNTDVVYLTGKGRKFARWYHPFKVFFNLYPVKRTIEWLIPIALIYLLSRYFNITIQPK